MLPHVVLIVTRRSEIEDKEVSESVLKRVSAGGTEIPSRKVRDNAAVGVMFNCVRGIAAEATTTVTSLGGFLPTFSSEPTIPMSAQQSSFDTMGDKVAQCCKYFKGPTHTKDRVDAQVPSFQPKPHERVYCSELVSDWYEISYGKHKA